MKFIQLILFNFTFMLAINAFAFDINAYCQTVAEAGGGSYVLLQSCIQEETKARNRVGEGAKDSNNLNEPTVDSNTASLTEMEIDLENFKEMMAGLPRAAMNESACGSIKNSEGLKRKYSYLFKVYGKLHGDFPKAATPIYDQVTSQQATHCHIEGCKEGRSKSQCESGHEFYTFYNDKLDESLKSAYERASSRKIKIVQKKSF